MNKREDVVELKDKLTWSIEEASRISGIGQRKLRDIYKTKHADSWRFNIGTKFRIKSDQFIEWLSQVSDISDDIL